MKHTGQIIGIAADHAGYELKEIVKKELTGRGFTVEDFGTHSSDSMDYPDVAHPLADSVSSGHCSLGFAICG
ncbi:MAG: RpiB/LacA/LacB family sugar-phosphate isomerase, partial [Bacteroidales bacterium]|nr:RpiB/LacA/LacB family sugar-phosphate isomerase [Bacteroidales bacterium]